MYQRYLTHNILYDLQHKMVFLGGPRQVGKTTFAQKIIGAEFKSTFYNYDKAQERKIAINGEWPLHTELIVLDEFHKYSKWKTWIKGEFDTQHDKFKFLLTGSARLDIYRRGGDSLQGRYHHYRLHPFSLRELTQNKKNYLHSFNWEEIPNAIDAGISSSKDDFNALIKFGGFPEPAIKQNSRVLRRWHNERNERLVREDIRDLTRIQDLHNLGLLADILSERASQLLSINSLAQDFQVNFKTMSNWIDTFEHFYLCFRLMPYNSKKIKAIKKERKLYLWDWSSILDHGLRLENLVASHLLKLCDYLHDAEGINASLNFLRDQEGREVDFLVSINNVPWLAVEVKSNDKNISSHLHYFKNKLNIPHVYQVVNDQQLSPSIKGGITLTSIDRFLNALI